MMMLSRHAARKAAQPALRSVSRHHAARLTAVASRQTVLFSSWPDHEVLPMPALSPTMESGNIGSWVLKIGDPVVPGNAVAEIETDKASVAFEAQDEGFLAAVLHEEGAQDIAVGTPIAVVVEDEADVAAFKDFTLADAGGEAAAPAAPAPTEEAPPTPAAPPRTPSAPVAAPASGERVFASPLARKIAREAGITVSGIAGSGPNGRVIREDVEAFLAAGGSLAQAEVAVGATTPAGVIAAASFTDTNVSNIRKVIAAKLTESKTTVPHYYLSVDVTLDKAQELRKKFNESLADSGTKLSINDFVLKASALAMNKVPEANSSWHDSFIREYHDVHINVAISTEDGLVSPVLKSVDNLGLAGISAGVRDLATRASENKLGLDDLETGTFTVSNLGMFGINEFSAIITPPQAAILAVGAGEERVIPDEDSETGYRFVEQMTVTLSCDHRVVDGAVGAQWLQAFKGYIEDPQTMLL